MSMFVRQIPFSFSSHHLFHIRKKSHLAFLALALANNNNNNTRVAVAAEAECLLTPFPFLGSLLLLHHHHHHHQYAWACVFPTGRNISHSQQRKRNSSSSSVVGIIIFIPPIPTAMMTQAIDVSDDVQMHSPGHEGSKISNGTQPEKAFTSNELMQRLKRYGISGVLSYGLLNTVYYLSTFLLVWFYIAPAPGRMGYAAAVERFLKVMAMVWAGSQVTKLVRAAGALALAPFVARGLSWFTAKLNFDSQWKAFMTIVGFCFGLALLLFFAVTLLWA